MPIIFVFTFIGLIFGIVIGVCLTLYYANEEFKAYEEEIANLTRLNEEQREATKDYINKLVIRNKELEKLA